jgi:enoyl-CoA hydratase/carnithine racemase
MFFPPGMLSVVMKKHNDHRIARDMIIFAKEYQAEEALKLQMIDGIWSEE